jgi:hypothetical protein
MTMVSRLLPCMLLAWHLAAVGAEVIRFLSPAFEGDRRELYAFQLLRLALSKTSRYFGCLLKRETRPTIWSTSAPRLGAWRLP